jgi:hypothetical protein
VATTMNTKRGGNKVKKHKRDDTRYAVISWRIVNQLEIDYPVKCIGWEAAHNEKISQMRQAVNTYLYENRIDADDLTYDEVLSTRWNSKLDGGSLVLKKKLSDQVIEHMFNSLCVSYDENDVAQAGVSIIAK